MPTIRTIWKYFCTVCRVLGIIQTFLVAFWLLVIFTFYPHIPLSAVLSRTTYLQINQIQISANRIKEPLLFQEIHRSSIATHASIPNLGRFTSIYVMLARGFDTNRQGTDSIPILFSAGTSRYNYYDYLPQTGELRAGGESCLLNEVARTELNRLISAPPRPRNYQQAP